MTMPDLPPIVITAPPDTLWLDAEQAARMISYKPRSFRETVATRPDFPKPVRIGGKGDPRWNAREIDEWMRAQRELTGGRKRAA